MKVITFLTDETYGYAPVFKQSLVRFGYPPLIHLGKNQHYHGDNISSTSLFYYDDVLNYLQTCENRHELVCIVDGFDCVFLQPPSTLQHEYNQLCKTHTHPESLSIVISGILDSPFFTKLFGPNPNHSTTHDRFSRPHSGMLLGQGQQVITFLEKMKVLRHQCDDVIQNETFFLHTYIHQYPHDLIIDTHANIIYNLEFPSSIQNVRQWIMTLLKSDMLDIQITQDHRDHVIHIDPQTQKIQVKKTNTYPCIVHAYFHQNIDNILPQLGYTDPSFRFHETSLDCPFTKITYSRYALYPLVIIYVRQYPEWRQRIFKTIFTLHARIWFIWVIIFFFGFNNPIVLGILLFISCLVLFHWWVVGECILFPLKRITNPHYRRKKVKALNFFVYAVIFIFIIYSIIYLVTCSLKWKKVSSFCSLHPKTSKSKRSRKSTFSNQK